MQKPKELKTEIQHDGQVTVAMGRSRKETKWRNKNMQWSEIVAKLATVTRTRETFAQYQRMTRDEKAEIKDVGGFVGGAVKNGRRKAGHVAWRSLLTLDADFADQELWSKVQMLFGNAMVLYSTHSHAPDKPKTRLVAPFSRQVTADEYEAISRFIAADIGIDIFDDTTYQPERLMYWPSAAEDGEFIFEYLDGPFISPDTILARHPYWQDASTWPESSRAHQIRVKHAEKQGDPRSKPGTVGAFCRTYSVTEAIAEFLSDIYTPCEQANRYTYAQGSASAGVVVYDSDLFSYSHHGTDPAGGILCNAFDLVRIHKFGIKDEDEKDDTPVYKLPSYQAMNEWAVAVDEVKIELANARTEEAAAEFGDAFRFMVNSTDQKDEWKTKLAYNEKGGIIQSIHNALLIMRHDPVLKGTIAIDEFTRKINLKHPVPWKKIEAPEPWTDTDDAALRHYLEIAYNIKKRDCINDALQIITKENAYHPIKEYLDGLVWDGTPRIETAMINFLGVEDNLYVREISRKWFTAAAARIRKPGVKFDNMIILVGPQGVGKSQFFSRLSKNLSWFSDSMSRFDNSKDAMEQLAGKWIIELGELSALKRYEVEHVKVFLSKQEDSYRQSYGKRTESFPRQCVFAGTTNREDFLQDATGARRFWPVKVGDTSRMWKEMRPAIVDQLWAEADISWQLGENLYLTAGADELAQKTHEIYTELGGKVGAAGEFLERKIPVDWNSKDVKEKLDWLHGYEFSEGEPEGDFPRTEISGVELFVECFGGRIETFTKRDAYEMSDILTTLKWARSGEAKRIKEYGKQRVFMRPNCQ
jgi:putative DNA primase/helicase